MSDPTYCYPPDHEVLRKRLGLKDAVQLDRYDCYAVLQRIAESVPSSSISPYLRTIHRHRFQDIYDWASKLFTGEIAKYSKQFHRFSVYFKIITNSLLSGC